MTKSITDVVSVIVGALQPLESEDRHRVVSASMTLLGEAGVKPPPKGAEDLGDALHEGGGTLPARAVSWIKQNSLSMEQIGQVFHWSDGTVEVIAAEMPGKNNKEKVRNAYVLLGVAQLLSSGIASFEDKSARSLCEKLGIYDHTNHMKAMKGGNEFTGSKDKGWTLTAPGLKRGAALIAGLAQ